MPVRTARRIENLEGVVWRREPKTIFVLGVKEDEELLRVVQPEQVAALDRDAGRLGSLQQRIDSESHDVSRVEELVGFVVRDFVIRWLHARHCSDEDRLSFRCKVLD